MSGPFSPALSAYLALSRIAAPVAPVLLRRRAAKGKEDLARLGERLGQSYPARPASPVIWLHGASVGEGVSLLPLIDALARPASGPAPFCLLTTGTLTSARLLAPRLAGIEGRAAHAFVPVDTARAVAGFLDHWAPDLAIWCESEFWPRLMVETAARGTPMMLVNARLSASSAEGWARVPGMARRLVRLFDRIVTQDRETAERLLALGADPAGLREGGNLKRLLPPPEADATALRVAADALGERPRWLAASTHDPEEGAVIAAHAALKAHRPALVTLLAPRHPERAEGIAAAGRAAGLTVTQRSHGEGPPSPGGLWIVDTLGEMGLWYRLAPVAFVGGSFAPMGGHNPFEPVALDAAILTGRDTRNFAPDYEALAAADGVVMLEAPDDLAAAVARLLDDVAEREAQIARARRVFDAGRPDLARLRDEALALMRASR
ncbi:MAG: glycosyltransferase N-terminal domain-containing protein [Pseudomonadota bacterium]